MLARSVVMGLVIVAPIAAGAWASTSSARNSIKLAVAAGLTRVAEQRAR